MTTITITQPDDWHIHLRDGAALQHTVQDAARQFARAIVMPNLVPPVTTVAMAEDYYKQIKRYTPSEISLDPLMVLYLTDNTSVEDIEQAGLAILSMRVSYILQAQRPIQIRV